MKRTSLITNDINKIRSENHGDLPFDKLPLDDVKLLIQILNNAALSAKDEFVMFPADDRATEPTFAETLLTREIIYKCVGNNCIPGIYAREISNALWYEQITLDTLVNFRSPEETYEHAVEAIVYMYGMDWSKEVNDTLIIYAQALQTYPVTSINCNWTGCIYNAGYDNDVNTGLCMCSSIELQDSGKDELYCTQYKAGGVDNVE